jgi:hypothetical protein
VLPPRPHASAGGHSRALRLSARRSAAHRGMDMPRRIG